MASFLLLPSVVAPSVDMNPVGDSEILAVNTLSNENHTVNFGFTSEKTTPSAFGVLGSISAGPETPKSASTERIA